MITFNFAYNLYVLRFMKASEQLSDEQLVKSLRQMSIGNRPLQCRVSVLCFSLCVLKDLSISFQPSNELVLAKYHFYCTWICPKVSSHRLLKENLSGVHELSSSKDSYVFITQNHMCCSSSFLWVALLILELSLGSRSSSLFISFSKC